MTERGYRSRLGAALDAVEVAVTAREVLLRAIVDHGPDLTLLTDEAGTIEVVGRVPNVEPGMHVDDIVPPSERDGYAARRALLLSTGMPLEYEAAGSEVLGLAGRSYRVRARRIDLPDGSRRMLFVGTDITDTKQIEAQLAASREELERSQHMELVGQLASGVAHDFNNVLTAIRCHATTLAEQPDATGREDLAHIIEAVDRGSRLTSQLLHFSKHRASTGAPLDLRALVGELTPMLQRLVGTRIRLSLELPAEPCWIEADRSQIEQVVTNLVVNARDAIATIGGVIVEVRAEGELVVCCVRDDGVGMSAEVRERVFEPFFTTKPAGRGTGLGLAIVQRIVTRRGGSVRLDSRPGEGTSIELRFPACAPPRAVVTPPSSRPPMPRHSARVLLVEDDDVLRRALVRGLDASGFRTRGVGCAREALEALENETFDAMVTDVDMPDMTGLTLAEVVASERGLPVLVISGHPALAVPVGTEFLAKPFSTTEISQRLHALLQGPPG